MMFCGGEEVRFAQCVLSTPEALEKPLVGCESTVEVCPVVDKLPPLSFQLKVLGGEKPMSWWRPVGCDCVHGSRLGRKCDGRRVG